MNDTTRRVLERLGDLGFAVRPDGLAPFGEELPLVVGVAWDIKTAQLALIAEMASEDSDAAWRQLLFAASGLRHQLAGDGPSAFGTPIVLAVVDDAGVRRLRRITEELSEHYALFNRVDLNLVRIAETKDDEQLDLALAPLLPSCRTMLGTAISRADVQRFWQSLREEIQKAAVSSLESLYAPYAAAAVKEAADVLIGDISEAAELPAPEPVDSITLSNFRSFVEQNVELQPATVIHGPNGGGKTTVIEALELSWAGRSQRQPNGVTAAEYAQHLDRNGGDHFAVSSEGVTVTELAERPLAELPRSVLSQDALGTLVSASPAERYAALLTMTGLEIPELEIRTERLLRSAKQEADAALIAAGLPRLARIDSLALKHLRKGLAGGFAGRLPSAGELAALERMVDEASDGGFDDRRWDDTNLATALSRADAEIAAALTQDADAGVIAEALDVASSAARTTADQRHRAAVAGRALLVGLGRANHSLAETTPHVAPLRDGEGLPVGLAVRWLSHGNSVIEGAGRFRTDAAGLDEPWRTLLLEYAAALEHAGHVVPHAKLEPLTRATRATPAEPLLTSTIDESVYLRAGFSRRAPDPLRIVEPVEGLVAELERQAGALLTLATELDQHPARRFTDHAPRVLRALCRFDLAKGLRHNGAVLHASERLLGELLQGRLAPVLRELTAAIVRFEWYFEPLQVSAADRQIVLGGLGTSRPDLDARLILNAAERTVVGVAWFLGLHMLQPPARRRVLVLDDPTGAFDMTNQAGFISTLRAFARLTRPDQIIVTTHDDALAAVLAEEMAPVDGWPTSVARVSCRRNETDASVTRREWTSASSRTTAEESIHLGLEGEAVLSKG